MEIDKKIFWCVKDKIKKLLDIKQHFRQVLCFYQRGKRGWSDQDCWSFDQYLAKVISEATAYLQHKHYGHPADLTDEEWTKILGQISYYFSLVDTENLWDNVDINDKKTLLNMADKEIAQLEEALKGFDLLKEHFYSLWD